MSDVQVSTRVVLRLEVGLTNIETVARAAAIAGRPIPPAKTGYALSKWGEHVEALTTSYRKALKKEIEQRARKDEHGKPVFTVIGDNRVSYQLDDQQAWNDQKDAMEDELVTITGVRALALSEFGEFVVPHGDLRLLLGVVVIDAEPK